MSWPNKKGSSLYRAGHETAAILGAFSFDTKQPIQIFSTEHRGDRLEISRSVAHELAHRSLALDSDMGALQLALVAMKSRPDLLPDWEHWLQRTIEVSWSTYEGFAVEREIWEGQIRGHEPTLMRQARYRDALLQYEQICGSLPADLRPWWLNMARSVADFSLNFSFEDSDPAETLSPRGLGALLGDRKRQPDFRLGQLSTEWERQGFPNELAKQIRAGITRAFESSGQFASTPLRALFVAGNEIGSDYRAHTRALDYELTPIFLRNFAELCPGLRFGLGRRDSREVFLDRARQELQLPIAKILGNEVEDHPWPLSADVQQVEYVHRADFHIQVAFDLNKFSEHEIETLLTTDGVAAFVVWGFADTVCIIPLISGRNMAQTWDPLRTHSQARIRTGEDEVMRFTGERLFFSNSSPALVASIAEKVVGAVALDEGAWANVVGDTWLTGAVIRNQRHSDIVGALEVMRELGVSKLHIVLRTHEVLFLAFVNVVGVPGLIEIPTILDGMIRDRDAELFDWYQSVRIDSIQSEADICKWGYIVASMVLAGSWESYEYRMPADD